MKNLKSCKCHCQSATKVKNKVGTITLSDRKEPESPTNKQVSEIAQVGVPVKYHTQVECIKLMLLFRV